MRQTTSEMQLKAVSCALQMTIRSVTRQLVNAEPDCQEADSSASEDLDEGTSIEQYQADLPPRCVLFFLQQMCSCMPSKLVGLLGWPQGKLAVI